MLRRTVQTIVLLATAAAVLVVAPSAANAGAPPDVPPSIMPIETNVLGETLYCTLPYLATAYGPLTQCTKILIGRGVPGLYSPFTEQFNSIPGGGPVREKLFQQTVLATDGFSATAIGYGIITAPRSTQTIYVTQYSGDQGRFGGFDLGTRLFTPSGPWFDIVR